MSRPASEMEAFVLTGHGGADQLVFRGDVPVPTPQAGEVLIEVGACGLNNTDLNTRLGWYGGGGWGADIQFPRIQGADVAGRILVVGAEVAPELAGERVLVDPWVRTQSGPEYLGSERDGGFAQYVAVPAVNAHPITSELSDAELATFPCSSSTAEHMLSRVALTSGETILVTGASGGVGTALVQLATRRGAPVTAVAAPHKAEGVKALGAAEVITREDLAGAIPGPFDVVADVVGGEHFPTLLDSLVRAGRYVTAGAIAGPVVSLDLRTLYLKDLTLIGATVMDPQIFRDLVGYIERSEIKPVLAAQFPLRELPAAQQAFIDKDFVGNLAVIP